jgi:hypothetical protein
MQQRFGEGAPRRADTPGGEVTQSIAEAVGSYFRTHPPSADRERRLSDLVAINRRRLAGREFYVGVRNYRERTARSDKEYPEEKRVFH